MTDPDGSSDAHEQVGSAAEEAAKLFAALRDGLGSGLGSGLGGLGENLEEHLATGAPECTYCPLCRGIHVIREASPEVRAHLASAGAALLQAAGSLLAAVAGDQQGNTSDSGVQPIDLDEDGQSWPEEES
ncbi:DUF5304 family protein [Nocardioides insulae]|uniref:DUF5304 family protein n=1 Tax=Nocardioides insulae TaxID=394734 RepID=UPI0003F91F0B|nr:DUF5304 family protein [Nocardioides insulae]